MKELLIHTLRKYTTIDRSNRGICPFCKGKNDLQYYPKTDSFYCFKCGENAKNAVSLLMKLERCDYKTAKELIFPTYDLPKSESNKPILKKVEQTQSEESRPEPKKTLERIQSDNLLFAKEFFLWLHKERGFTKNEIQKLSNSKQITDFCNVSRNKLFPIVYFLDSSKTFFNGRYLLNNKDLDKNNLTKTHNIKGYNKQGKFFNAIHQENQRIFLVEGVINALSFFVKGESSIALFDCNNVPNTEQFANFVNGKDLILSFDNDKAGKKGTLKLIAHLLENKERLNFNSISVFDVPSEIDINDLHKSKKLENHLSNTYNFLGVNLKDFPQTEKLDKWIKSEPNIIYNLYNRFIFNILSGNENEKLSQILQRNHFEFENAQSWFVGRYWQVPTGVGKTFLTLSLAKYLDKTVFLCPTTSMIDEFQHECKNNFPSLVTYGIKQNGDFDLDADNLNIMFDKVDIFFCTYASLRKLANYLKFRGEIQDFNLVMDEAHNSVANSSPNFQLKQITNILSYSPLFKSFTCLSGTAMPCRAKEIALLPKTVVSSPKNPNKANICKVDRKLEYAVKLAIKAKENGKKNLILFNNKGTKLTSLIERLNQYGIKSDVVNANTKNESAWQNIVKNHSIKDDIDTLIITTVLKEGNSIYSWKNVSVTILGIFHSTVLEQVSNRFRDGKRFAEIEINILKSKKDRKENDYPNGFDWYEVEHGIFERAKNIENFNNKNLELFTESEIQTYIKEAQKNNIELSKEGFLDSQKTWVCFDTMIMNKRERLPIMYDKTEKKFSISELFLSNKVYEMETVEEFKNNDYQKKQLEKYGFEVEIKDIDETETLSFDEKLINEKIEQDNEQTAKEYTEAFTELAASDYKQIKNIKNAPHKHNKGKVLLANQVFSFAKQNKNFIDKKQTSKLIELMQFYIETINQKEGSKNPKMYMKESDFQLFRDRLQALFFKKGKQFENLDFETEIKNRLASQTQINTYSKYAKMVYESFDENRKYQTSELLERLNKIRVELGLKSFSTEKKRNKDLIKEFRRFFFVDKKSENINTENGKKKKETFIFTVFDLNLPTSAETDKDTKLISDFDIDILTIRDVPF